MKIELNPLCPSTGTGSANRHASRLSETVREGLDRIFDVHWGCPDFMSAFANGEYKGLSTVELLDQMISNWPDAKLMAIDRVTASERAAMELASAAWKPFFELVSLLEEQV